MPARKPTRWPIDLLGSNGQAEILPLSALRRFENAPLERAFAVQLVQRLRDLDPKVRPVLVWLDQRLAAAGTNTDEMVRTEHQQQGTANVSVRNIITSMRLISAFDWQQFFESVSLVDEILRNDTDFAGMDFPTRDSYRHAIEDLSRGSNRPELEVARRVVQRVKQAASGTSDGSHNGDKPNQDRHTEPGYYLISRGRPAFEQELGFRVSGKHRLLRLYIRAAIPGYLGTIAIVTAMILALPLLRSRESGMTVQGLLLLGFLAFMPASDLAIALINRSVMALLGPQKLPRMEYAQRRPRRFANDRRRPHAADHPGGCRRSRSSGWKFITSRIRTETCASPCSPIGWTHPAKACRMTTICWRVAVDGIALLNQRYGPAPGGGERFFLFHRKRVWNESEGKWMGWERKTRKAA